MAWPTTFANLTNATGVQLDNNFNAVGDLTTIQCVIAGTNALTLTLIPNTPPISILGSYGRFAGVIAATNTGAVTAQVAGAGGFYNCYKDTSSGPVALVPGDLVINNYTVFVFDAALNGAAGGFHVSTPLVAGAGTVTSVATNNGLTGGTITTSGTIGLATVTNLSILANVSGGTAIPSANTLTNILDQIIGTSRGGMIVRGASTWGALAKQNQFQQLYVTSSGDIAWGISKALGLAATGTNQGSALALTAAYNEVTTTPASTGVIFTPTTVSNSGGEFKIFNRGANTLNVYPPSGAAIDNNSVNAAVTLAANVTGTYTMVSDTQIYSG